MAAAATDMRKNDWIRWRRRVRVALVHQLPIADTRKAVLRLICELLGEREVGQPLHHPHAWAFASVGWLAQAVGRDERTIQRAINWLIDAGLLEKTERFEARTGRQTSNLVRIVWPRVGALTRRLPFAALKKPLPLRSGSPSKPCSPRRDATLPPASCHPPGDTMPPSPRHSATLPPAPCHPLSVPEDVLRVAETSCLPQPASSCTSKASEKVGGGRFLWGWLSKKQFETAVRDQDLRVLRAAYEEAVQVQALAASKESWLAFVASCFDVRACASPKGVLFVRVQTGRITLGHVGEDAQKWASRLLGKTATGEGVYAGVCLSAAEEPSTRVFGIASGCRICTAAQNEHPSGCEACNPAKRTGRPTRGAQVGERVYA